ncbi:hypothetical protein GCM10018785_21980 [Streptomyces longispororuber]|uniref:Uncharacterized protein n=1 Tax=Streptomyces longispororuber TaxID=68230 RepID=A0A918ZGN8_9ACTN|nr:hypothetical protein GCM10018785_21980 [Streptomyces longispororuber]
MSDRDVSLEGAEGGLVEDLGHEAHVLEDEDLGAVADRDSRGFLAPMLEGVEPEVRELCDLFARSPDTEDAACVLGAFLAGEQIVIESTVTTWHATECRRDRPLVRIGDGGPAGGVERGLDGVPRGCGRVWRFHQIGERG